MIKRPSCQKATTVVSKELYQLIGTQYKQMSVQEYKELAISPKYSTPSHKNQNDLEGIYWEHLATRNVIYGEAVHLSLFDNNAEYWNFNSLDSILNDINMEMPGINTPYLYFGMFGTTFCWHTEDVELYSINYNHFGAEKTWFGIPPSFAKQFESTMMESFPENYTACPAFWRHKAFIAHPNFLDKQAIKFNKVTQKAGEFIVTFPSAYHFGYNNGYNCAEAVNFATTRWIDYGKNAILCNCPSRSVSFPMDFFVKRYQENQYEAFKARTVAEYNKTNKDDKTAEGKPLLKRIIKEIEKKISNETELKDLNLWVEKDKIKYYILVPIRYLAEDKAATASSYKKWDRYERASMFIYPATMQFYNGSRKIEPINLTNIEQNSVVKKKMYTALKDAFGDNMLRKIKQATSNCDPILASALYSNETSTLADVPTLNNDIQITDNVSNDDGIEKLKLRCVPAWTIKQINEKYCEALLSSKCEFPSFSINLVYFMSAGIFESLFTGCDCEYTSIS